MILKKSIIYNPKTGMAFKNTDEVEQYLKGKIDHFRKYENWVSKREIIELFREFLTMVDEDLQTIEIDCSGCQLLYADKFDKKQVVLYFDIAYLLGTIAYHAFDYDKNALVYSSDGENGPIPVGRMLFNGYCDLRTVKANNDHFAFNPTLIFTTVLETEIKRKLKWKVIEDLLSIMDDGIENSTIVTTQDEDLLLDCLHAKRTDFNAVYVRGEGADTLFSKYHVYDSQYEKEQRNLIIGKMTLNQLLQSQIANNLFEDDFLQIMKYLFGVSNLNLRNNIVHGGFGYQNYHNPAVASVLYLLCTVVINDFHLKSVV